MKSRVPAVAAIVILGAASGYAQTTGASPRALLSVNGGYQATSNDFRDGVVFRDNTEEGRFDTEYDVSSGPTFDVSGSRQIRRWLGVGGGVSRFSRSAPAALTASVPHPFFFNRPRSVNGNISGLGREELALHFQLRAVVPVRRLQVSLFGGPSWFRVKQGMVTSITYTEEYPYDQALFRDEETTIETEAALGFNAGVDTAFFFTRQAGIGVLVQYAGATVNLHSAGAGWREVKAGGIQTGAGLRLRF
jgi:hypothetical protein